MKTLDLELLKVFILEVFIANGETSKSDMEAANAILNTFKKVLSGQHEDLTWNTCFAADAFLTQLTDKVSTHMSKSFNAWFSEGLSELEDLLDALRDTEEF